MADLKHMFERAQRLPSQGIAGTYEMLNVHTEPTRQSPSFLQVKPGDKLDVVRRVVAPRAAPPRPPLVPLVSKRPKKSTKKEAPKYPPLDVPKPPALPANWLELSKTVAPAVDDADRKPVAMDDWTLIRIKTGEAGWVLTSRLFMAIPDDVAQYAEGHRITSYFALADVTDDAQLKHDWLWTTISSTLQPHDFDSFRVFIWNLRRHRYETAYIERNLKGYFPVRVHSVTLNMSARVRGVPSSANYPGFSVCIEKDDGRRYRRSYAFITNVVRYAGEQPCDSAAEPQPSSPQPASASAAPGSPGPASFFGRMRARAKKWFGR
jgi:hypothetical protein